jgi:hypothetical protein
MQSLMLIVMLAAVAPEVTQARARIHVARLFSDHPTEFQRSRALQRQQALTQPLAKGVTPMSHGHRP